MVAFLMSLFIVGALIVFAVLLNRFEKLEREIAELRRRLDETPPAARPVPAEKRIEPAPSPRPPLPYPGPERIAPQPIRFRPPEPAAPPPAGAPPEPAASGPPEPSHPRSIEQLVGGIWLQNVGSVLLLLGMFFLILWGYTTGRFGPGVLVAAGVVCGVVIAWRGDRVAKRVPAFGHALIGIGLGAAYLSLYLGHFALAVLNPLATTILLALTSIAGLFTGWRYRVQTISALAVIGAFVPQVAAVITGSRGFVDSPALLFLYFAGVDIVVFALAARSGWSRLALLALLLTDLTWVMAVGSRPFGWPVTLGLAALFVALGLSPVPRVLRGPVPMRAADAGVVLLAPYAFVVAAWPFLAGADRHAVGALFIGLALVEGAAAAAIHRARGEHDLFRMTATAASVFLTAALERLLGDRFTPMAWTVEGVALTAAGIYVGSPWMRRLGAAAAALGVLAGLPALGAPAFGRDSWPLAPSFPWILFTAESIRSVVQILALFVGAHVLERAASAEADGAPRALNVTWLAGAQFVLLCWLAVHAVRLAGVLIPDSGIPGLPGAVGAVAHSRSESLGIAIIALAWSLQAGFSIVDGMRRASPSRRGVGYILAAIAGLAFAIAILVGIFEGALARNGRLLQAPEWFEIATLAAWAAGATLLTRFRAALAAAESNVPAAVTIGAHVLLWAWLGAQGGPLALVLVPAGSYGALDWAIRACAWTAQAFALGIVGVRRGEFFRRVLAYLIAGAAAFEIFLVLAIHLVGGGSWAARADGLLLGLTAAALALGLLGATLLARFRHALATGERNASEALTLLTNLLLVLWSAGTCSRLATGLDAAPGVRVAAVLTSAAWVLQALILFVVGWRGRSPFVRWTGLGLFGLTLAKVALFDLASVDVFWRFLIAIGFGLVLLGISYVYQRSRPERHEAE